MNQELSLLSNPDVNVEVNKPFTHFNLDPRLESAVLAMGYTYSTPIQTQAIPLIIKGCDVMGAAQTGTGKTAAFCLPILHCLLPLANNSSSPARHPLKALILAPTRELADQIYTNLCKYAQLTPIKIAVVLGGVDFKSQELQLQAGVDILVATPGRLLDHVNNKILNLSQLSILVLDEADRMLDMGFMPDLDRILAFLPKKRQTLLFSATFNDSIRKLAHTFLMQSPHYIETTQSNTTANNITQWIIEVDSNKPLALIALLKQHNQNNPIDEKYKKIHNQPNSGTEHCDTQYKKPEIHTQQTIVFVNSKLGCSRINRALQTVGLRSQAIHGDRSQAERLETLRAFKQNQIDILVATDIAARGLDIAELPCVINYDIPYHPEDYIHRIGRTGRAGASGVAYTLCMADDIPALKKIEQLIKQPLKRQTLTLESVSLDSYEQDRIREVRVRRREIAIDDYYLGNKPVFLKNPFKNQFNNQLIDYTDDPLFTQLYIPKVQSFNLNHIDTNNAALSELLKPVQLKKNKVIAALFK